MEQRKRNIAKEIDFNLSEAPAPSPEDRGLSFALNSLSSARRRLSNLSSLDNKAARNLDEIWETFADVETAIAMSRFISGSYPMLGKERKLHSRKKEDDPLTISFDKLCDKYHLIDLKLKDSEIDLKNLRFDRGIEMARQARDEIKAMLLCARRSERQASKEIC